MRTLAETYRGKGEEAALLALENPDPFIRQTYGKIADHWHELAARLQTAVDLTIATEKRSMA
jgi:hypothetical protein